MTKENKFKKDWDGINKASDKINPIFDVVNDGISKSTELFNKGAKKSSEKLNDVSAQAAGQKKIKCPRCKSLNVSFMENDRKKFSMGKAIGGNLLAGNVGTLAGFAGKKGKKNHWRCNDCGNTFKA